jgi:hypothetical protein
VVRPIGPRNRTEDLNMSKSAKQSMPSRTRAAVAKPSSEAAGQKPNSGSKQSRVIAILQSPDGATIDAMMQATGWQQHSVRGFLAGVVRKKLKLKLSSTKIDGHRVYRIDQGSAVNTSGKSSKRRAA